MGGGSKTEGISVYIWMADSLHLQQKLTYHCKAIILQLYIYIYMYMYKRIICVIHTPKNVLRMHVMLCNPLNLLVKEVLSLFPDLEGRASQ